MKQIRKIQWLWKQRFNRL